VTKKEINKFIIINILSAVGIVFLVVYRAVLGAVPSLDLYIYQNFFYFFDSSMAPIIVAITNVAHPLVILLISLIIYIALVAKKYRRDAFLFLAAVLIGFLSYTAMKLIFHVARPPYGLAEASGWSFPSGHASISAVFFLMLAYLVDKHVLNSRRRLFYNILFGIAIIVVSFTRIYLGVHWTSDILGGILLGVWVTTLVIIFDSYRSRIPW